MQKFNDEWTRLEWHADTATMIYAFFVNGKEVADIGQHKGAVNYEGIEILAAFQTLSIGFTNDQPAKGEGFGRGIAIAPRSRRPVGRCAADTWYQQRDKDDGSAPYRGASPA